MVNLTQIRMNKKGQDMSIGTLILIVLGIIVLVLLVLGFSLGWGNLWEKINIFGGSASVGDIATRCGIAVTSNNVYDYCQKFDKVKVSGQVEYVNCQDPRIENGLESKLDCGEARKSYVESARLYCNEIGNSLGEKTSKINGLVCSSGSVASCNDLPAPLVITERLSRDLSPTAPESDPKSVAAVKKACESDGNNKLILSGFKESKSTVSGKVNACCVLKNYELGQGVLQTGPQLPSN